MVHNSRIDNYPKIFSNCRRILGARTWGRVLAALAEGSDPQTFADRLLSIQSALNLPGFIPDLARLEWVRHRTREDKAPLPQQVANTTVNPTLTLVPVAYKNMTALISADTEKKSQPPEPAQKHVMVWRHSKTGALHTREADNIDLLALKIIAEQIDPREAAAMARVNVRAIHTALQRAIDQGIVLSPGSRIRRAGLQVTEAQAPFLAADIFTLQWHITQACDLHCKHCYDRSDRTPMSLDAALAVLDDFYAFCQRMHVSGQVSFTGGNPMLYPHFEDLYRAAWERGFGIAILGNPTPLKRIERLLRIAKPVFFQISLEGLPEHNDDIRGRGHFHRSLVFLDQLRHLGIYTMVMLTLTRDNLDQVLPLGHLLEERADSFTFNRLATVGEGARLMLPLPKNFENFMRQYETAAEGSPVLGLKDNLINIIRNEKGKAPFGGCTGYGCGAAFNFVALLSDGEVHACRKFPSPIGNIFQHRLFDIYQSDLAKRYRRGSEACRGCGLAVVCRGCLASTFSHGLDVFTDKDPFCFELPTTQ